MLDLTFGEQVKIILSRKGMTIKELAEQIEESTGKKMSRQNLTQRLGRDNFQEQDMRMIAEILGCSFHLTILDDDTVVEKKENKHSGRRVNKEAEKQVQEVHETAPERDITVGELVDMYEVGYEEQGEDGLQDPGSEEETVIPMQEEVYAEETYASDEYTADEYIADGYTADEYIADGYTADEYTTDEYAEDILRAEEMPEEVPQATVEEVLEEIAAIEAENQKQEAKQEEKKSHGWRSYFMRRKKPEETTGEKDNGKPEQETEMTAEAQPENEILQNAEAVESEEPEYADVMETEAADTEEIMPETAVEQVTEKTTLYEDDPNVGERNPYTGKEYESNSVRMHPTRIGYVQVYDRENHQWTDMTEWAFLGYQERKKALLGKDYEPPIYLD